MAILDRYSFVSIKDQSRSLHERLPEIMQRNFGDQVDKVYFEAPTHTNGEWRISFTLSNDKKFSSYIKASDLQQSSDQEIYEFIVQGIESAR